MMFLVWFAIVSGFGSEMVQLNAVGQLHFPLIVHIHAAAFVGWLVLFTVQIALVRTKNLALHKKLGLISFGLIPVMLILGINTAIFMQKLSYSRHEGDLHFLVVQLGDMLIFGTLAGAGIYLRKNYIAHKRLMLLSTLALTDAGFARWLSLKITPLFGDFFANFKTWEQGFWRLWIYATLLSFVLIVALGVYDLVTRKQLAKVYIWAVAFYLVVTVAEGVLYYNDTWYSMMKVLIGVQ
jgi:hypothetical protein